MSLAKRNEHVSFHMGISGEPRSDLGFAGAVCLALILISGCASKSSHPSPPPSPAAHDDAAHAAPLDRLLSDMRGVVRREHDSYHRMLRESAAFAWDACAGASAREVLHSLAAQGATAHERSFDWFTEYRCVVERSAFIGPTGLAHNLELVFSVPDQGGAVFHVRAVLLANPGHRLDRLMSEQTYPPGTAVDTLFKSTEFQANRPSGSMLVDLIEIDYGPFSPRSPEASFIGFSIRLDWSDDKVGPGHTYGNGFFSVTSGMDEPPPWGQLGNWRHPPRDGFVPHDTLGGVMYWGGSTGTQG